MPMSKVQALSGRQAPTIPMVPASHYPLGSVTNTSGLTAGWRVVGRGDSEGGDNDTDEEEEESSKKVQGSKDDESPGAEESSEAEDGSDEEESSDDTDDSEEDRPQSILKESSGLDGPCTHDRKVSFGSIIQKTDQEATKGFKDSFQWATDGTERRKTWKKLDPNAQDPPKVTEGTEVVTDRSGRGSVAVMSDGRRGFVKNKRS